MNPTIEELLRNAARTMDEIEGHKQGGRPVASEATSKQNHSISPSVQQPGEGDNSVICHECGEPFPESETETRNVWNGLDVEVWDFCSPCADEYDAMVEYESAMQMRGPEAVWI